MARVSRVWGAAIAAFFLISAVPAPRNNRPNILLIVVDTLRFDAVSPATTPFLASLSKRGVVFTHAYSTHDFTPTSHYSIFTGLHDGLCEGREPHVDDGLTFLKQRARQGSLP